MIEDCLSIIASFIWCGFQNNTLKDILLFKYYFVCIYLSLDLIKLNWICNLLQKKFIYRHSNMKLHSKSFPRQSLLRFTFRVKLSDSIFLGLSPIVKLIWREKQIFWSILREKYCLIHLEIVKRPKKRNYNFEIFLLFLSDLKNTIFKLLLDFAFSILGLIKTLNKICKKILQS